jgi:hypothetical protein
MEYCADAASLFQGWGRRLATAAAAIWLAGGVALAQESIVGPGNAAVTGFSGIIANEAPEGEDPFDYVTINPDGPAAQVIDLSSLGPQGQLSDALKTFVVPANQIGQVFGVALDNAPQPSIYLAATAAYGLSIYLPDASGAVKRIRSGAPGAQFVPGQFGPPEYGGSPGSIWKVDGATGQVFLFASIEDAAEGVASLGGLAFDPVSQQIFVADRASGIIYRLGLDGAERGSYDHGTEGRPPAGLAPIPWIPTAPVDINSPFFDTENPGTWGQASPARRVFGLAVRNGRLYYAIAQGPQIWSVGISPSGAVAAGPRLEVEVPSLQDGVEIASITFDAQGRMYLAERGATMGDYELTSLASGGASRVLRFVPKPAGDPAPGLWRLLPDQYAIGMAPAYANADGGVALGYGYQPDGTINYNACRTVLWSTGERLLDPGDPLQPPDSYPAIDGLQGNAPTLVLPQNAPPLKSWFVDYDDQPGVPEYRGYMGGVAIYSPCAEEVTYTPPPPPPSCPPGTVYSYGQCVVVPTCPPGASYKNGACVYPECPKGYVLQGGQCVPPPISCPPGFAYYQGKCVPLQCPPGMERMPNGQCICPVDNLYYNGKCIPPQACPPGMVKYPNGVCWCPAGTHFQNGKCVPNFCPPGYVTIQGKCVPQFCPPGFKKDQLGFCVPVFVPCSILEILINGKCVPKKCPQNQVLGQDGKCHPILVPCKPPNIIVNGKCVPKKCPPLHELNPNGKCVPIIITCKPGQEWNGNKCVSICKKDEVWKNGKCQPLVIAPKPPVCKPNQQLVNGKCVAKPIVVDPIVCAANMQLINGKCVPIVIQPKPIVCKPNQQLVNGKCVPLVVQPKPIVCKPNQQVVNGKCVNKPIVVDPIVCAANMRLVNGKCVPLVGQPKPIVCPGKQVLVNGKCTPPGQVKPKPIDNQPAACPGRQIFINGKCLPPGQARAQCKQNQVIVDGKCVARGKAPQPEVTIQPVEPEITIQPTP